MQRFKVTIAIIAAVAALSSLAAPAAASDDGFSGVFRDAIYGGLTGGLVGGAFMVFENKPLDHAEYIAYGAAVGVMVGTFFGIVNSTRSRALVQIESGTVTWALPTLETVSESGRDGRATLGLRAGLFRAQFCSPDASVEIRWYPSIVALEPNYYVAQRG